MVGIEGFDVLGYLVCPFLVCFVSFVIVLRAAVSSTVKTVEPWQFGSSHLACIESQ